MKQDAEAGGGIRGGGVGGAVLDDPGDLLERSRLGSQAER